MPAFHPIPVPAEAAGQRLDHFLARELAGRGLTRSRVQGLIREGHVRIAEGGAALLKNLPQSLIESRSQSSSDGLSDEQDSPQSLSQNSSQNLRQHSPENSPQPPPPGRAAKPGERLRAGMAILFHEPPAGPPASTLPEALPLDILYEDADLIILNKPAGMVVHPAAGNPGGTLVNALLHHCAGGLSGIGGEARPGIVHRLDKETSGCIVAAKNDAAHAGLARQFAARETGKIYLALVAGLLREKRGTVDAPVGRHPVHRKKMAVLGEAQRTDDMDDEADDEPRSRRGRHAVTDYRVLREEAGPPARSLVECTLHTGRTHQIRVHMKHLGHPILGDELYGRRGGYPRQMLHAWRLAFAHPRTGERLAFTAPPPPDFLAAAAGGG